MTEMKIIFLGTSGAIPTNDRNLSSIVIWRGDELLLFDTGEGMQRNFIKSRLPMNKKMKIFISHIHGDHCIGLLGLLQTLSMNGRTLPIKIYGDAKISEFVNANLRIINFYLNFEIILYVISGDGLVTSESDYKVTCCQGKHSIISYSFCLEEFDRPGIFNLDLARKYHIPEGELFSKLQSGSDIIINNKIIKSKRIVGPPRPGRKIGISGDTRPTKKLQQFFKKCDVLIFDSTFGDKERLKAKQTFHSTATEAAILASNAKVKKLFLTHFSARYSDVSVLVKEAKKIFNDVESAEDLKIAEVKYSE